MDFGISPLIFFAVIGVFISFMYTDITSYGSQGRGRPAWKRFVACQAVLMIAGNLLSVGISFLATRSDTGVESPTVNVCEVAEQMGLASKRPYPVEVGARVGGSYGDAYFWSGLFSSRGEVEMRPGSALSVGFDYQGRSAILELPLSKMTFVKDADVTTPTISVALNCEETVPTSQVVHLAPAHWRIESGFLILVQEVIAREDIVPVDKNLQANGLAPLVAEYLQFVEVHLSPELYAKILG